MPLIPMSSTYGTYRISSGSMSTTEDRLFSLHVLEVKRGLYMEDESGHKHRHTTEGNNYWSFNVSLSFLFHL